MVNFLPRMLISFFRLWISLHLVHWRSLRTPMFVDIRGPRYFVFLPSEIKFWLLTRGTELSDLTTVSAEVPSSQLNSNNSCNYHYQESLRAFGPSLIRHSKFYSNFKKSNLRWHPSCFVTERYREEILLHISPSNFSSGHQHTDKNTHKMQIQMCFLSLFALTIYSHCGF